MRKRKYQIIEIAEENDLTSRTYDISMMIVIFASLVPFAFKEQLSAFYG